MDNLQKILIISLVSVSGFSWILASTYQANMMSAMITAYDPLSLSLFVAVWTAGMAAMMFPAISPVVLLYSRLVRNNPSSSGGITEEIDRRLYSPKMILFVGSYLAVWAATGLALLTAWSIPVNALLADMDRGSVTVVYGAILTFAGAYQFSPLKSKCLGYCESPMSLFMRRWKKGTSGAISMGTYHGLYCLGCCWPYFLIMVALGWMDIVWMALFAGVIFGEKMWSKGIWVARAAGLALAMVGVLSIAGLITIFPADDAMSMPVPESMDIDPTDGMASDGNEMSAGQPPESKGMVMDQDVDGMN
jgi:predicted metal-binding membrane protein